MNPLEIALIIIGIITIIISCRLVDRPDKSAEQAAILPFSYESSVSDEDKRKLMEKLNEMVNDINEDTIVHTDDALSKISNEKIMAVNEFSDQILEKIKRNHEEVVFLYNMLNDKEKELKAAVKEIDQSKKKVQDIIESRASAEKVQDVKKDKSQTAEKLSTQAANVEKSVKAADTPVEITQDPLVINSLSSNNNSEILALYSKGKSVMEISKLLGLGQGEVKLVIDLFKGKK
ncbi:MAG TPA: DUF6115 domain-containing protein [Mobilitalea sp.]|nr:DUF6115 domain-containing protein [Mobilitalea sp.]